jgi:hypothetical protein
MLRGTLMKRFTKQLRSSKVSVTKPKIPTGFSGSVMLTIKASKLLAKLDLSPLGGLLTKYFYSVEKHHGTRMAVNQLKALYNESIRFSCGLKVEPTTPIWVKRDKDNYPCILKSFKGPLRSGSVMERRMCLSLLRTYESLQLNVIPNLETVTSPSKGAEGYASFHLSFKNFLDNSHYMNNLRKTFAEEVNQQTKKGGIPFHFSTKKGVAGPTCATAGLQSLAVDEELKAILKEFNSIFRKGDWVGILEENQEYFKDHKDLFQSDKTDLNRHYLGRITFIPDKGGKTRIVAIGNYWIQDCLRGLHQTIYRVLKTVATDGTYGQSEQFERVREASSKGPVWSYDLTAATDRFPVEIQVDSLKSLNSRVGELWNKILNSINFYYKGQTYKYEVGQPMGLYSSWAVFALTHHIVIQYCAFVEREKFPFNKYAVLGDDVAIWSPSVAKRYSKVLSLLDVSISEAKSFVPDSLDEPCVAEFAKRISDKGVEISALSPNQVRDAYSSYWNWTQFAAWLDTHGFDVRAVPISRVSESLGLAPFQLRNLCCSLRIWEVLRAPVSEGYESYLPEGFKDYITKENLVKLRLEALVEQASSLWADLFDLGDENRAALEKRLGGPVPDKLYFIRIMDTRIQNVIELENKMVSYLPQEEQELFYFGDEAEESSETLPELSEIEYLPRVDFKSLVKGITQHEDKKTLRGRYIQKLVKLAKSNHETEV